MAKDIDDALCYFHMYTLQHLCLYSCTQISVNCVLLKRPLLSLLLATVSTSFIVLLLYSSCFVDFPPWIALTELKNRPVALSRKPTWQIESRTITASRYESFRLIFGRRPTNITPIFAWNACDTGKLRRSCYNNWAAWSTLRSPPMPTLYLKLVASDGKAPEYERRSHPSINKHPFLPSDSVSVRTSHYPPRRRVHFCCVINVKLSTGIETSTGRAFQLQTTVWLLANVFAGATHRTAEGRRF